MGVEIGGFTIKEVGILDDSNKLFAVGKFPPTYKPSVEESTSKAIKILFNLTTSNAAKINLKVGNTKVYVTRDVFQNYTDTQNKTLQNLDSDLDEIEKALSNKADKTDIPTNFYTKSESDDKFALKNELTASQTALNELKEIRKGNVGNIITKFYPVKKENSFNYFVCDGAPILKEE
ncbi:phage tail protein [Campylobacter ureolyticus]|uniref:Phage tail protein n=1 Tax=Campylobacter ureolyticus TaxID=827 RepID=A0A9Q4PXW6_9BACT|nr:phage tail protein [Campylobacter ureolyticus]MCZ6104067.1 phage tail protein [Campylobacter ureolyticus]MCZ6135489.1 phage tail protein [Campylobacter ureolyticus]MCZ6162445.1 phage tail protein [Campylobacter ureolyticus]MCZ6171370.1 phage tail protein [Campylobacter ureolyticus]MDU4981525.1 phage tail protein [Campylobacter ureolyticus]